jgi:hypothetical protein
MSECPDAQPEHVQAAITADASPQPEWKRVPSIVAGDVIRFRERVFRGKFPWRKRRGSRTVIARVLRESYGAKRQQHTFTIEVISCEGNDPLAPGTMLRRKGRNFYRMAKRRLWDDETARLVALEEKYARREVMKEARRERKRRARRHKANRRRKLAQNTSVMAGLVPAIHDLAGRP